MRDFEMFFWWEYDFELKFRDVNFSDSCRLVNGLGRFGYFLYYSIKIIFRGKMWCLYFFVYICKTVMMY